MVVDDRALSWSWGSKTIRIDGQTLIATDSRAQPDTQTFSLAQAFDDPGRLFVDPPEIYAAMMRALAERLDDSDAGRRPRRAFWLALAPGGCAPLAVSWSDESSGHAPKQVTLDLDGVLAWCTVPPPDSYRARDKQTIDDLFFYGPREVGIPATTRALVLATILAALDPGSGVDESHAFPQIDHAQIARASWTWGQADDGESGANTGGPAVVAGYQYGHDMGWSAYSAERVATRAPSIYTDAPRDVWDEVVATVRAAIVPA